MVRLLPGLVLLDGGFLPVLCSWLVQSHSSALCTVFLATSLPALFQKWNCWVKDNVNSRSARPLPMLMVCVVMFRGHAVPGVGPRLRLYQACTSFPFYLILPQTKLKGSNFIALPLILLPLHPMPSSALCQHISTCPVVSITSQRSNLWGSLRICCKTIWDYCYAVLKGISKLNSRMNGFAHSPRLFRCRFTNEGVVGSE